MMRPQLSDEFLNKYVKAHSKLDYQKAFSSNINLPFESPSNHHQRPSRKIEKSIFSKSIQCHYPEAETQVILLKEAFSKVKSLMNENTVVKFLNRKMVDERFHYRQEILSILTDAKQTINYLFMKEKDFKVNQLMYELSKTLNMIEEFISSKSIRQIQILQSKIRYNQGFVQDSVDLDKYKQLTFGFRPTLITNSLDIIQEYRSIDAKRKLNPVQVAIYKKLAQTERAICGLHNQVCKQKEQMKFFIRKKPK